MLGRSRHMHTGRAASILITAAMAVAAAFTPMAMVPQAQAAVSCTPSGQQDPQPDSSGNSSFYYTADCDLHISGGNFDYNRIVPTKTSPMQGSAYKGPYKDARRIIFDDPEHTVLLGTKFQLNGFMHAISILGLPRLDVSKITSLNGAFADDRDVLSLDLSSWNVSNVTDMSDMFSASGVLNLNIVGWDTKNVTNMSNMFYSTAFDSAKGLGDLDTSNVVNMSYMFYGAGIFNPIDLSKWDTRNVTDMSYMFNANSYLDNVKGMSSWNVSKVVKMRGMFSSTDGRITLDMSNWHTDSLTDAANMFSYAHDVSGLTGTKDLNVSKVRYFGSMFGHAGNLSKLDMSGWVMDAGAKMNDANFLNTPVETLITGPHARLTASAFGNVWSSPKLQDYTPQKWSRVPEDINDDSGYWISQGTIDKADEEVAAEISTGRGGTWVRTIAATLPVDLDTVPDGSAASWSLSNAVPLLWPKSKADSSVPTETPKTEKPDWRFSGWNAARDGTGTAYAPGQFLRLKKGEPTLPTLYAQWERVMRSVKYVGGEGASSVPAAASVPSGSDYTVPAAAPSRPGYTFLGWSDSDGGEVKYRPGDSMKELREDRTLYAIWRINGTSMLPAAGTHAAAVAGILSAVSLIAIACGAALGRRSSKA